MLVNYVIVEKLKVNLFIELQLRSMIPRPGRLE